MMLDFHPVEKRLTSRDAAAFQIQSWIINRSYFDEIFSESLLRSLLAAPKNHIYQKWTSKVIACLSGFTIESPWVDVCEKVGLKKSDIKSHTLNLPVSRLIANSLKQTCDRLDWRINLLLASAFLIGQRKSSYMLSLISRQPESVIKTADVRKFDGNSTELEATLELIESIGAEILKNKDQVAELFSSFQFLIESNWMLCDGMYMELFASPSYADDTKSDSEGNPKNVKVADAVDQSLNFVRNKATAEFLG